MRQHHALAWACSSGGAWLWGRAAFAAAPPRDAEGCRYQRDDVFEFAQPPSFRRVGQDQYEITFASKGNCDVTVGIVDGAGVIVRHLGLRRAGAQCSRSAEG